MIIKYKIKMRARSAPFENLTHAVDIFPVHGKHSITVNSDISACLRKRFHSLLKCFSIFPIISQEIKWYLICLDNATSLFRTTQSFHNSLSSYLFLAMVRPCIFFIYPFLSTSISLVAYPSTEKSGLQVD